MSDADDRRQLQDVMLSYAAAVDDRDMARYRACFADDCEIVGFGEATISGRRYLDGIGREPARGFFCHPAPDEPAAGDRLGRSRPRRGPTCRRCMC